MNTNNGGAAVRSGRPTAFDKPRHDKRPWWQVVTTLLLAAFFVEAVFAGAMLSGAGWARTAHAATAMILIASPVIAGLAAMVTLRRVSHGSRLGLTLLSLGAAAFLQAAVGALSAKGANLIWLHVPLGVALVGFAAQAVASARRLGEE